MAVIEYRKEGKIATFTLNRPEAMNAVDPDVLKEFNEVLTEFRADPEVWVGIITGTGDKAFCAGADIKKTLPWMKGNRGEAWRQPPTILRGLEVWKPFIAAVNGMALGGGLEIVLACDLRIAAENARFGVPEVRLGLIPGWGGASRLAHAIPPAIAAEMLFTGRPINAQEAYRIGLVNKVVPLAELMPTAKQYAEHICEVGPLAVRAAKQAMTVSKTVSLEEGLRLEVFLDDFLMTTEDFEEGTGAFVEKRKASFKGK